MGNALSAYHEEYTYDPNGNILSLNRKGDNSSNYDMDDFTYHYISGTNKLEYVDDAVSSGNYNVDIDDQSSANYAHDNIGNLIQDNAEGIDDIEWTVYGKIKKITKNNSANITNNITFEYSPDGHRVSKKVEHKDVSGTILYAQTTYYVRDAQGNVMATYMMSHDTFFWQSSFIYGSSRLGEYNADEILDINGTPQSSSLAAGELEFHRGNKKYELSNHLGNVLAVVSDKRTLICVSGTQYYEADILSAQDYYPFGMQMESRSFTSGVYRYGFQGQEKDDEIQGVGNGLNFKFRLHDSRIGKFFSIDPLTGQYPFYSPYIFSGNRVIDMVEFEGAEPKSTKTEWLNSEGYENWGDYYNHGYGAKLELVENFWVYSTLDGDDDVIHKYWDPNDKVWKDFTPEFNCTSCDLSFLMSEALIFGARYLTPVEDIQIFVTGRDFDNVGSSKELALFFLVLEIVPGSDVLKPITKFAKGGASALKKVGGFASEAKLIKHFEDHKSEFGVKVAVFFDNL